ASLDLSLNLSTVLILVMIGAAAGTLSGFIGVGGGVIIVPALIYFFGRSQVAAQGTALLLMLPPIGALAVVNYWKAGVADFRRAGVMAVAFVLWAGWEASSPFNCRRRRLNWASGFSCYMSPFA
ncbi:MAG: TSUP family transporter, partial [Flavobacteriales bacterium]|nr:TSUP family transporter [Flavobacteriales bacterium]